MAVDGFLPPGVHHVLYRTLLVSTTSTCVYSTGVCELHEAFTPHSIELLTTICVDLYVYF